MAQRDPFLRQLGEFLRIRRAETAQPTTGSGHRQVPGLRRSEVAKRAFISPDYYTRIEQARLAPSTQTLDAIARALDLDADQQRYAQQLLARFAEPGETDPCTQTSSTVTQLLQGITGVAAILIGPETAVVDWNAPATQLLIDFNEIPEDRRNYARLLFEHTTFQARFCDLETMQRTVIGILRAEQTASPSSELPGPVIERLLATNDLFARTWAEHEINWPHRQLSFNLRPHTHGSPIPVTQTVWQDVDNSRLRLLLLVTDTP